MKRKIIRISALTLAAGFLLLISVRSRWPVAVAEIYVPLGKITDGNRGLCDVVLTNTTIIITRPICPVVISNVHSYLGGKAEWAVWIGPGVNQYVECIDLRVFDGTGIIRLP